MSEFDELKASIEAEYEKYCEFADWGERYEPVRLFELLTVYLKQVTQSIVRTNSSMNEYDMEDIVNDALADIWEKGLKEGVCETPETRMLRWEQQLESINLLKKYIRALMSLECKPFRNVACCFSLLLFHRYFPDSKKKASPKWAFEELEKASVKEGEERFISEMKEWMPGIKLYRGNSFYKQMYEMYQNKLIYSIIFCETFKLKDFSNWTDRVSEEVKKYLLESGGKSDAAFKF